MPDLRQMAGNRENHALALDYGKTGIAKPELSWYGCEADKLTEEEMESWVKDIDSGCFVTRPVIIYLKRVLWQIKKFVIGRKG